MELRSRLERRPQLIDVPVLTSTDLAAIKPRVVVRSLPAFRQRVLAAVASFLAAFWVAHFLRRRRRADDDPLMLPALMLLTGIGLTSMIALRDPLRDTMIGSAFVIGVIAGVALLVAASEIDFEASPLRRAVLLPLGIALALAVLLLLFGSGPGASGAKVNLAGVQPVEVIRLLVILALAAYFARRLDFLRELSEPLGDTRPWLRWIRVPRWKDVRPVAVSMALVLAFFFLQKDLGPALVMSCVFLALYGIARGRAPLVVLGLVILASGFAVAYAIGFPATVRQRVMIWADPWNNGVTGGNQVAHGIWAMSTGGPWGLGQGLGSPQVIPAGHTDLVLAAIGEELGFAGVAVVMGLYVVLGWRCLRIALRAPGDYTAFLAAGITLALVIQALVIAGGLLGLLPLAGVVTPFLSYGKSSMLANFAAIGVLLAIARRRGAVRLHLGRPMRTVALVLSAAIAVVVIRALWLQ
ncbi:MAG: FtsW/RodA/SpoVE family cell cycle protein, partial [Burkholderiales bacterium]